MALGLVTAIVAAPAVASETQNHSELHRPDSDLERRLMSELACTCGGCELEPIDECKCPFAARMRKAVKERLAAHDLSSDAARAAAYDEVRSSFVEEFGNHVLRRPPEASLLASLAPFALVVAGLVTMLAVVFIVRRRARRTIV